MRTTATFLPSRLVCLTREAGHRATVDHRAGAVSFVGRSREGSKRKSRSPKAGERRKQRVV